MSGVAQAADGRWRWHDATQLGGLLKSFGTSVVSFDSEADALADLVGHEAASTDCSGRLVRTQADLGRLLHAALSMRQECRGIELESVERRKADKGGCNWHAPLADAHKNAPCVNAVGEQIDVLRHLYNLPGEHVEQDAAQTPAPPRQG